MTWLQSEIAVIILLNVLFISPSSVAIPFNLVYTFIICWLSFSRLSEREFGVKRAEDKNVEEDDVIFKLRPVTKAFASIPIDFLKVSAKRIILLNKLKSISRFFFAQMRNSKQ